MANEKRLIDAYRLWEHAWNELQKANKRHENEPGFKFWSSGVAEVIAALAKDMPTVDAVEVVHGRWIDMETEPKCSVCGKFSVNDKYATKHYTYCPHCGALMDGGNEDVV